MTQTRPARLAGSFLLVSSLLMGACTSGATQSPAETHELPTSETSSTLAGPAKTPEPEGRIFVVVNSADNGSGTLRRALQDAQPHDTIAFDTAVFPPSAPAAIAITSELPHISQGSLTIDASNAGVILDGGGISAGDVPGLVITSNGNTIQGLQIVRFPGSGISLSPGSQYNMIGGDQVAGIGPLGHGNLISDNGNCGILAIDALFNTIQGNYIGTDPTGTQGHGNLYQGIYIQDGRNNRIVNNVIADNGATGVSLQGAGTRDNLLSGNAIGTDVTKRDSLGNHNNGIEVRHGASHNRIGPDNVVAYNEFSGIEVYGASSSGNTITRNRIHSNAWLGIDIWGGANGESSRPVITASDLSDGVLEGLTYPNVEVEVFSTESDEGDIFEGRVVADDTGVFVYSKGASFSGPHLVATATDANGNTSEFSLPTFGTNGSLRLQRGNPSSVSLLTAMQSKDLEDNRIASWWHSLWGYAPLSELLDEARYMGAKRFRFAINGGEADKVDWSRSEFSIDPDHERFITDLAGNGIQMTIVLTFWDLATWPGGVGAPCPRFKTEEQIQHYLDYVRFIVRHFEDRIQYYEIWNEPEVMACPQWIEAEDYVTLVGRAVPVIRDEYPEARIQVGGNILASSESRTYLFSILASDIMPLVDVVSWHPFYGESPEQDADYYYAYPSIVQNIMDVAHAHGFTGEFEADEANWRPHSNPETNRRSYGEIAYAKYWLRGILMNLGINVTAGNLRIDHSSATASWAVRYLSTVMAGNVPVSLPVVLDGRVENIKSYGFALPSGEDLLALWIDGVAVDSDPGTPSTLVVQGRAGHRAVGVDVLHGYEQQLVTTSEGDDLVIRDFLIRDYPVIIRFIDE